MTLSDEEATRHRAAAAVFADGVPPVLRVSAMAERGWLCVAVEDELDGPAADRLANACAAAHYTAGWSVEIPWNPSQAITNASRLALTARAIESVARDICLGSPFVLMEEAYRFALASDGDLCWMLAGERAFVEAAIDATVEQQLAKFEQVVQAYSKSGSLAGMGLNAVHAPAVETYQRVFNDAA